MYQSARHHVTVLCRPPSKHVPLRFVLVIFHTCNLLTAKGGQLSGYIPVGNGDSVYPTANYPQGAVSLAAVTLRQAHNSVSSAHAFICYVASFHNNFQNFLFY